MNVNKERPPQQLLDEAGAVLNTTCPQALSGRDVLKFALGEAAVKGACTGKAVLGQN